MRKRPADQESRGCNVEVQLTLNDAFNKLLKGFELLTRYTDLSQKVNLYVKENKKQQ